MSLVPIGCASDRVTMYEENTPVILAKSPSELSFPIALPVDTTVTKILSNALFQTPVISAITFLMDVTIELTIDVPEGDVETSQIYTRICGDLTNPNPLLGRDIVTTQYTGFEDDIEIAYVRICGMLTISSEQPILLSIERAGGNSAVSVNIEYISTSYKRLD